MTEEIEETRPYWNQPSPTKDELVPIDAEAIDLAIKLVLGENDDIAGTVRQYLADDEWWEGGTLAVYHRQMYHLQLDTWQYPPCWINENEINEIISRGPSPDNNKFGGAKLLKKMIAAGISQFHPKPIDALAKFR
jgi:hypothetical protein